MASVLLGAAAGLAGAGVQNAFGQSNMKKQHEYSKALLDYQWQNQIPETVNSLRKSGLNVGLMYSNGGPSVGGSTGSTTSPQISNPLLGVGELMLDQQFKKEQIEAMRIENIYREERLTNENKLGALKLKTEEYTQSLLSAQFRNTEQQTALGEAAEEYQKLVNEYQRDANPALISTAYAKLTEVLESAQKMKDESEQVRLVTANLGKKMTQELLVMAAQAFYYTESGKAVSSNAAVNESSLDLRKELQPRIVAVQEAAQKYREDMQSWEKYSIFMRSLGDLAEVLISANILTNIGKGSQMKPMSNGKLNSPYKTDMDFEFPDF